MSERYSAEKSREGEKQAIWDRKIEEVKEYKDQAGNKMDEEIVETVVALNVNDIPTIQSCAGHTETGAMPWVKIQQPGRPVGVHKPSDVTPEWKQWKEQGDTLREKVQRLLDEFNVQRKSESGILLTLNISNDIRAASKELQGMFKDDPYGINPLPPTKSELSKLSRIIPLTQEEMQAFTIFLKDKFFKKLIAFRAVFWYDLFTNS